MHAYERTHPVYDYNLDPCGAVHITIGDGGNSEGLSFLTSDKTMLGMSRFLLLLDCFWRESWSWLFLLGVLLRLAGLHALSVSSKLWILMTQGRLLHTSEVSQ